MTSVSVQLPDDVMARLNRLADTSGRSVSSYITETVLEHLDDLEDVLIAEQRLEALQSGQSQTYSLEDVERDLDVAD